jgi:hypothetical protein
LEAICAPLETLGPVIYPRGKAQPVETFRVGEIQEAMSEGIAG